MENHISVSASDQKETVTINDYQRLNVSQSFLLLSQFEETGDSLASSLFKLHQQQKKLWDRYLAFGSWFLATGWCNEKSQKFGQYLKHKASEVPYQRQGWEHLTMLPESTPIPVRYKDFFWYWQQHAMYKSLSWVRDWCQLILKECCEEVHWSHLGTFLQHFYLSF